MTLIVVEEVINAKWQGKWASERKEGSTKRWGMDGVVLNESREE